MRSGFEEIQHTADWALKVWAPDFACLLEQAALGMNQLMGVAVDSTLSAERVLVLTAADREGLLVAFLNRILYEMEMDSIGFDHLDILVEGLQLKARLTGGKLLELQKRVKAVTYHNLMIHATADGLETTIVMDV